MSKKIQILNFLITILLLLTCHTSLLAQQVFQNEWIDYTKTYYKIKVAENGLYRISMNTLQQHGIPTEGKVLRVYHEGEEIPIYVSTEGAMQSSDYLEFYGQKNDGSFDTHLFQQKDWQLHDFSSLFTDTAMYYLTWYDTEPNLRFQHTSNVLPNNLPPKDTHFAYESKRPLNNLHYPGESVGSFADVETFSCDFNKGEGFTGAIVKEGQERTETLFTKSIYDNGEMAKVEMKVVGRSDDPYNLPDHHIQILINDQLYHDAEYEGYKVKKHIFEVPLQALDAQEVNRITLKSLGDISVADKNALAYLKITYPHSYDFEGERQFLFDIRDTGSDKYLEITNFSGGNTPILYDLTKRLRIEPNIDNTSGLPIYKFYLKSGTTTVPITRTLVFFNTTNTSGVFQTVFPITQMESRKFRDYRLLQNQGNYLIISHPSLEKGTENQVTAYQEYRNSPDGGSYQAIVADIEELYDQFAVGNRKHPLAIKNFINYAIQFWDVKPEFLLLLGKAVGYNNTTLDPEQYNKYCLVPTYGHPSSDIMLSTANVYSYHNQLATGRVPAYTPAQIRAYLRKIQEYEAAQRDIGCQKTQALWQKNVMHIAGGSDLSEAELFTSYLNKYKDIIEGPNYAGDVVVTYTKANEDEAIEFPDLQDVINNGLSLITFVGHSSRQYWGVGIGSPYDYDNKGKYPFIISSSCFVGNIHGKVAQEEDDPSMAEDYILAEDAGAIGFFATVSFGFPRYMDIYINNLYQRFSRDNYGTPIGQSIKNNILQIDAEHRTSTFAQGVKLSIQEYTLAGDPVIDINAQERPEYLIEYISPAGITANVDSFAVKFVITNIGRAVADSFTVKIDRRFPNNTTATIASQRFPSTVYADTITMFVPTSANTDVAGENMLTITIDANNDIPERCEDNNRVENDLFVFSDLLIPISPCDYSIVSGENVTLSASTGRASLEPLPYIIQIDTSSLFLQPLDQNILNSQSGVIDWQPSIEWEENRVYYWRTSQIPPDNQQYNWQTSSFAYKKDSDSGWNQSHFYQFTQNQYNQMRLDTNSREFEYTGVDNDLIVTNNYTSITPIGVSVNVVGLIGQSCLNKSDCTGGVAFAAFKPAANLIPLVSERTIETASLAHCDRRGTFGNLQCSGGERAGIEFYTGDINQVEAMLNFLENEVPTGYYLLAYSVRNHRLGTTDPTDTIYNYLADIHNFFATKLDAPQIANISNDQPFIVFGRKGVKAFPTQVRIPEANQQTETFSLELAVPGSTDRGGLYSPVIGPTLGWNRLEWNYASLEAGVGDRDDIRIEVLGIKASGEEELLLTADDPTRAADLSFIDEQTYPYLRLHAITKDTVSYTAPQLRYWRVHHKQVAELALDIREHFEFNSDTLQEGQPIELSLGLQNAGNSDVDSILVHYSIINNTIDSLIPFPRQAPLAVGENTILKFSASTEGFVGDNLLQVIINPTINSTGLPDQPEKFRFNNSFLIPFHVKTDDINPVLDVTFDGQHIVDGQIVAAQPHISISVKDENPYLALNDPTKMNISLIYPDGTAEELTGNDNRIQFFAASDEAVAENNNKARWEINPDFSGQDGVHQLIVAATDRSNNEFGANQYKISFKIINQALISNVLPYPNPFTTSTRFVFTLTGSEIPDFLKIQIMTISGKVVKEINKEELGSLRIGHNISDYAWDGTDVYGNVLANGVYLYRVVARDATGQKLDNYALDSENTSSETAVDDFFRNGIGKMYLMR